MIPAALMVAGTVMQMAGQYTANMEQAKKEKQTADWFNQQADFAREAMFRELSISERQYAYRLGAQVSSVARGGADVGSGSVTNDFAATLAARTNELVAIKRKGMMDVELARLRGINSQQLSDTLSSSSYNNVQALTTVLGNTTKSSDSWVQAPTANSSGSGKSSIIQQQPSYYDNGRQADVAQRTA